ncbi:MAG: HRDC domain-containing protein [Proteocatella sp.]
MDLFSKLKEPIFLKEDSSSQLQLDKLRELEPTLNLEGQNIIRQDIKYIEYGIVGENNIEFELRNSHMPMYILHDIYLEYGDLSAQIDYIVFTKKMCFVIECKNLYGDIDINSAGDFIRTIEFGGRKKKEGIYSPITQNQRHLELMKKIRVENKSNVFSKFMAERYFEKCNIPIVVLSNPKTMLNSKFAKKDVKDKIIRADQLVKYIKNMYNNSKETALSDDQLLEWAKYYLNLHKENIKDYTQKYDKYKVTVNIPERTNNILVEETDIFKELKTYRLKKSREENIKPYLICNDNQLKELILKMPRSKEQLKTVSGFGNIKAEKYGEDIIEILSKY